jgi:hypothetical protein
VHISEIAVVSAVTVSIAGVSYAAFNTDGLTERAQTVADAATCRTVDSAIVAYLVDHDGVPRTIADLKPYVRGDISRYRIVGGLASGPGCDG